MTTGVAIIRAQFGKWLENLVTNESKWYLTLTFARKAGVEICLSVDFVSLIELPKLYFPGHVLDFGSGWLIFWIYQSSYL